MRRGSVYQVYCTAVIKLRGAARSRNSHKKTSATVHYSANQYAQGQRQQPPGYTAQIVRIPSPFIAMGIVDINVFVPVYVMLGDGH